jgi:YidC/Oxa1 family membrane protein insertase
MNSSKKNISIIVGIIAFIALYQYFVLAPYQAKFRQAPAPTTTTSSPSSTSTATEVAKPAAAGAVAQESIVAVNTPASRDRVVSVQAGADRSIEVIEGAALGRAQLNDYLVRGAPTRTPIVLNNDGLVWSSSNAAIQQCLNSLNKSSVLQGTASQVLMKATTVAGMCEFSVSPDPKHPSLVNVRLTLDGFNAAQTDFVELRSQGKLGSSQQADQNYIAYKFDDSIHKIHGKDLFPKTEVRGRMSWMTWGDRYFSVIFKPTGTYTPDMSYGSLPTEAGAKESEIPVSFALRYSARPEADKTRFDYSTDVYFGTRDPTVLNAIDPELVQTVDLGFFASVARVMLWSLKALNKFFHNFGVSIIALTLIVRLLFWPLNKKAYSSTIAMKELQPEMERIRKKYDSTDRTQAEKMNKEVFALYKTRKVNPLGGCLPMLLQLPIFIGLYGALNHSIDLYQAPFFGWIQDLSMRDPYYILPVMWTLSLLGYMQVNPQAMNTGQPGMPNMKWIMMGMNVFFGFLSKDWPSGLVVYLVVSNCVGLSQQFFLQRSSKKLQLLKEGA